MEVFASSVACRGRALHRSGTELLESREDASPVRKRRGQRLKEMSQNVTDGYFVYVGTLRDIGFKVL